MRRLMSVLGIVALLCVCCAVVFGEELKNDSRITAVAVRITFSSRVMITDYGREFSNVVPSFTFSEVYTFDGGQVRRNESFEVEWAPHTIDILSVDWLEEFEPESAEDSPEVREPIGPQTNVVEFDLNFESIPEVGVWPIGIGEYRQGGYAIPNATSSAPAVGLIENLSHDLLHIETRASGSGTGIVFGYRNAGSFYAFYQDLSFPQVTALILEKVSGRPNYQLRSELARVYIPKTAGDEIGSSYMAAVVSEGHVACYFEERLVAFVSCEGVPSPSGAGLYFGRTGSGFNSCIFDFLHISDLGLTRMPTTSSSSAP